MDWNHIHSRQNSYTLLSPWLFEYSAWFLVDYEDSFYGYWIPNSRSVWSLSIFHSCSPFCITREFPCIHADQYSVEISRKLQISSSLFVALTFPRSSPHSPNEAFFSGYIFLVLCHQSASWLLFWNSHICIFISVKLIVSLWLENSQPDSPCVLLFSL